MKDLFNHIETLPTEVQKVLERFSYEEPTYEICEELLNELKPLGYEFQYGLDYIPYDLKCVNTKELAINWWFQIERYNPDNYNCRAFLSERYFNKRCATLSYDEIEQIYLKETQVIPENALGSNSNDYPKKDDYVSASIKTITNQKQFVEFDADKFEAYINKFKVVDQMKMIIKILPNLDVSQLHLIKRMIEEDIRDNG